MQYINVALVSDPCHRVRYIRRQVSRGTAHTAAPSCTASASCTSTWLYGHPVPAANLEPGETVAQSGARALDLPPPAPRPRPAGPVLNRAGPYIPLRGVGGGAAAPESPPRGWARNKTTTLATPVSTRLIRHSEHLSGGRLGFSFQVGEFNLEIWTQRVKYCN